MNNPTKIKVRAVRKKNDPRYPRCSDLHTTKPRCILRFHSSRLFFCMDIEIGVQMILAS